MFLFVWVKSFANKMLVEITIQTAHPWHDTLSQIMFGFWKNATTSFWWFWLHSATVKGKKSCNCLCMCACSFVCLLTEELRNQWTDLNETLKQNLQLIEFWNQPYTRWLLQLIEISKQKNVFNTIELLDFEVKPGDIVAESKCTVI